MTRSLGYAFAAGNATSTSALSNKALLAPFVERPRTDGMLRVAEVIEGGTAASGLVSDTLISRFAAEQSNRGLAAASVAACGRYSQRMKNIETLISDGGDITIGMIAGVECGATEADGHNAVAMLVRRAGEAISALLQHPDKAVGRYCLTGDPTEEINPTGWSLQPGQDGRTGRSL